MEVFLTFYDSFMRETYPAPNDNNVEEEKAYVSRQNTDRGTDRRKGEMNIIKEVYLCF